MAIDPSKVRAIALQKTVLLVNNFIANTTSFLNIFTDQCESKLAHISSKITQVEISLAVLEAKLNSIPGLDVVEAEAQSQPQQQSQQPPQQPTAPAAAATAPPPPDTAPAAAAQPAAAAAAAAAAPPAEDNSGMVAAKDHPDYAQFFKLLKIGVVEAQVRAKVVEAGLDPSVLSNPGKLIPAKAAADSAGGSLAVVPSGQPLSRSIFDKYDRDRNGRIDRREFQLLCHDFGYYLSPAECDIAVKQIDRDGNGTIEYDEFVRWWKTDSRFARLQLDDVTLRRRQVAAEVFRRYDRDLSGALDKDEFRGLYDEIVGLRLTTHDLTTCMADMDADNDGLIQFNEFVQWLDRH